MKSFIKNLGRSIKSYTTRSVDAQDSDRDVSYSSSIRALKDTVSLKGKSGVLRAFSVSRRYASYTQIHTQVGIQSARKALDSSRRELPGTLKRRFLAGMQIVLPIAITILLVAWVFTKLDNILQPAVRYAFGYSIPGVGIFVTLLVILLAGIIAHTVTGRKAIKIGESVLLRFPLVCHLYSAVKQILASFSSREGGSFLRVVLVEFPKRGAKTIGFVTNEARDPSGKLMLTVFVPTVPNPTSGFLQIVKDEEVVPTNISVDDALKIIISAGRISAPEITGKKGGNLPDADIVQNLKQQTHTKDRAGSPL